MNILNFKSSTLYFMKKLFIKIQIEEDKR